MGDDEIIREFMKEIEGTLGMLSSRESYDLAKHFMLREKALKKIIAALVFASEYPARVPPVIVTKWLDKQLKVYIRLGLMAAVAPEVNKEGIEYSVDGEQLTFTVRRY